MSAHPSKMQNTLLQENQLQLLSVATKKTEKQEHPLHQLNCHHWKRNLMKNNIFLLQKELNFQTSLISQKHRLVLFLNLQKIFEIF